MNDHGLIHLSIACAIVHFLGARFIWRRGFHFPAFCFAVTGVVLLAFALSLARNGAPGS